MHQPLFNYLSMFFFYKFMYRLQVINKFWFWEGMFLFIFLINIIMYWFDSIEVQALSMKSISWLFSAGLLVVTEVPLWFHIVPFAWSPLLFHTPSAAGEMDLWLLPGLISSYPWCHQTVWHLQNPPTCSTTANRCVWPAGSDCTDRRASKRGGRYSIKSDQTVFRLYFYSDDSTSFTQDILPFFFCQKLPLCAWKGADAEAAGRSDPRALRGWLKNKLISGSIDGGQAGKYHGKLNYRDSWERRHWPALINSM